MENGMYIGYSPKEVIEKIEELGDAYVSSVKSMKEKFEEVRYVLRSNWIGPDERRYEANLQTSLGWLAFASRDLYRLLSVGMADASVAWNKKQSNNLYASVGAIGEIKDSMGDADESDSMHRLEKISEYRNEYDIYSKEDAAGLFFDKYNFKCFEDVKAWSASEATGDRRGITSENSANIIKEQLLDFVTFIQRTTSDYFNLIDVNNKAFYGTQSNASIKKTVAKAGKCVGSILTSIKNFDDAIQEAVANYYSNADTDISSDLDGTSSSFENDESINNYQSAAGKWDI